MELDPHLKQILETSLLTILEQHFFLLLDPPAGALPESLGSSTLEIGMTFSGELNGEFSLIMPTAACAEAFSGMSGAMEPGTPAEVIDTAKEILNYLGPNILIEWAERVGKPVFTVSIPSCREISSERWKEVTTQMSHVHLTLNGEPILLAVRFKG
jgi:hypothetical protein